VVSEHVAVSRNITTHILKRTLPFLIHYGYPKADAIVAVSQSLADDLSQTARLNTASIQVIHNPIVTGSFKEQQRHCVKHPWFAEETPVVLGVGRLSEQKNFDLLIKAFALARQQKKLRLMILGEGEKRKALEQLIKQLGLEQDVQLMGYVDNIAAYMTKASIFVLSSDYEGFGNVLVEAMACGCPVVSTDCPVGPSEILAAGRYGQLVPVNNAALLADALLEGLANPKDANALRHRAEEFSVEVILPKYKRVLFGDESSL
jgi:glycosyltransferase involved in cell wall biosynthesis